MDFTITKEQRVYKDEIIEFARANLNNAEYFETFSMEQFKKVADFGLLGIVTGEEYGGLGETYLTAAIVIEALGYGCKNSGLIFVINNHIWVAQNLIYLYGSETLKHKYIKNMVEGKKIGAIAITEAESGSDAFSMKTKAELIGDEFVLNGSKMFISNGPIADIYIVFAVTDTEPKKSITAFVVERDSIGLAVGQNIEKMGLNACPTSELVFKNVKIPKENVLGRVNQGSEIMTGALEWERCYEFAPHIGVMQRLMEECIDQAKGRVQFGKPIESFQGISHKIAEMQVSIAMARLMLYKIAWLKDQGKSAYLETSIFKLFVSENYIKTCRDAMQIFGCYGYTVEYGIERELRDALACSIYSGSNEMQKNTIYSMADISI